MPRAIVFRVPDTHEFEIAFRDTGEPFSLVVGRDIECDVILPDSLPYCETVSRFHVRFFRNDGGFWIEDLGSRNLTWMDGRVVLLPSRVTLPCEIKLGKMSLAVCSEELDDSAFNRLHDTWAAPSIGDGFSFPVTTASGLAWPGSFEVDHESARWIGALLNVAEILTHATKPDKLEWLLIRILQAHLHAERFQFAFDVPLEQITRALRQLGIAQRHAQSIHELAHKTVRELVKNFAASTPFYYQLMESQIVVWGVTGTRSNVPEVTLGVGEFSTEAFTEAIDPETPHLVPMVLRMATPVLRNLRELEAFRAARISSTSLEPDKDTVKLAGKLNYWGQSRAIQECLYLAEVAAKRYLELDTEDKALKVILLEGEIGSGKSSLATLIHRMSSRSNKPLLQVSAPNIPSSLAASELFGIKGGVATGVPHDTPGLFSDSEGKIIFIDEIGNIPLDVQAHLLTVLSDGTFRWVGETNLDKPRTTDAFVIVATSQELNTLVENGEYAPGLLSRFNTFRIKVPALRDRREDISLLVNIFLESLRTKNADCKVKKISKELMNEFLVYDWPENVRELTAMIHTAVSMASIETETLDWEHLLPHHRENLLKKRVGSFVPPCNTNLTRKENIAALEREYTARLLREFAGKFEDAAKRSGGRGTFGRMEGDLKKYLINASAEECARFKALAGIGWSRIAPGETG